MSPPADFPVLARAQLSTTPADGSAIDAADAPQALVLHMGGPAEFLWFGTSVELRRVAPDGSEATVIGAYQWAPASIAGETVTLALPAKLDPGNYRIVVLGGSDLAFTYAQGSWDPARDHSIAEFEVKAEPAAMELGTVGPNVRTVAGHLDVAKAASDSYRIRLAEGTALWRLALQVDADRIGSGLIAALAVYDADGRQVAGIAAWPGLPTDHPDDPYLFAGLAPGEYTVVVTRGEGASGGPYRLNLVATQAGAPTRVSSFALERSGGGFSGFTISFSSAIDPTRLRADAVAVVDAFGAVHAARLVSVDEGLTGARFRFEAPLPEGEYRLLAAGDQPLADLIGRIPIADGLPAGTLASWTVSAAESGAGVAPPRGGLVAAGPFDLRPGGTLEIPVTLRDGQSLVLSTSLTAGALRVELVGGPDGRRTLADGVDSASQELWFHPGAGDYVIRIVSIGGRALAGSWSLTEATRPAASLIARAVGSRGAIGLGMGEGASPSQPATPTGNADAPAHGATAAVATAAGRSVMGPSPWAYGAASQPVGRPTTTGDAVAPVGPASVGSSTSVAWAGEADSAAGSSLILSEHRRADDSPGAPPPRDGQVALAAGESTPVADAPAETDADAEALDRAERVADAILGRLRWLIDGPAPADAPGDVADHVAVIEAGAGAQAQAAEPEAGGSAGKVQRSALELPFTVLFVTATTFHLRRASRRWWNKRKIAADAAGAGGTAPVKPLLRGPRFMTRSPGRPRIATPRRG